MNRFGKKILCGCLAVSLMLTSVGCSEKTENAEAVSYTHLDVYKRQVCMYIVVKIALSMKNSYWSAAPFFDVRAPCPKTHF